MAKSAWLSRDLIDDVYYVTSRLFECGRADELRKRALELLQPLFKADAANFFLGTDKGDRLSLETVVSSGIDEKWHGDFRQHYHKYDPFRRWGFQCPPACTTDQVISYRELAKTCYYNEFLKPQSIHSQLCVYLRSGRRLLGTVALFRSRDKPVFTADEKEKACLMAPHLIGALKMAKAVERDATNQWILDSIASEMNKGIVVLNERYEIIYTNDMAKDIVSLLGGSGGTRNSSGRSLPDRLSQCLLDFCSGDLREFCLLTEGTRQPVSVIIKHGILSGKSVYKIILESDHSVCLSSNFLEFGLTGRQSEVVSLVCDGYSNSEISDRLCISEYTVENHLRLIYEKMNARNRTSLVHKVLSIPHRPPRLSPHLDEA